MCLGTSEAVSVYSINIALTSVVSLSGGVKFISVIELEKHTLTHTHTSQCFNEDVCLMFARFSNDDLILITLS